MPSFHLRLYAKNIALTVLVLLLLVSLSFSSIHEDEGRINSEGMWQKPTASQETKVSDGHGNSRFDVGGMLTAAGLKTSGSLLGLVVFPVVFPIVALLAIALFIISIFSGAAPLITGRRRRSDTEDGVTSYVADLAHNVLGSEQCVERIGCEILDEMGHKTKILFRLLRKFDMFFPAGSIMEKVVDIANIPGNSGEGQNCSSHFKCDNVRRFIARTWERSFTKYFT